MFLEAAHISTPSRDVKALLSRYQYEDSQHADRLKERLVELRVSKRRAYEEPNQELKVVFNEALDSRGTAELLAGLTRVIKPARTRAYRRYAAQTNGLADYGGVRTLKEIIDDEEESVALLRAAYAGAGTSSWETEEAEVWAAWLEHLLKAAGDIDGTGDIGPGQLKKDRCQAPYVIPREQTWADTFPRVWDVDHMEDDQVPQRLAQMVCTRLGELTIAEALSFVLCETGGTAPGRSTSISRDTCGTRCATRCSAKPLSRTYSTTAPPCRCANGRPNTCTSSSRCPSTPCSATSRPAS